MTDTPDALLPCPFCGGKARTAYVRDGRHVVCACGSAGASRFHGPLDQPDADARAIAAWNTRTTASTEQALAERDAEIAAAHAAGYAEGAKAMQWQDIATAPPEQQREVLEAMRRQSRGFAAIGLHQPKTGHNLGAVLRAGMCYGAASICVSGQRIGSKQIKHATNTLKGHRHIPVFRGELQELIPYAAVPVAVDLISDAEPLNTFEHPHSAFYIFGPEDGTLGKAILDWCPKRVMIPTRFCMNLAATVNVVLYDRMAKRLAAIARAKDAEHG